MQFWLPVISGVLIVLFLALVIVHTVRSNRPYREEEQRYERLAVKGQPASAEVLALRELAQGTYDNDVELRLRTVALAGRPPLEQTLKTRIARELVVNFMPGQTIHVLVDPADTTAVAIDRRRSTTTISR
ncbi:DUF3592 domain-containing protein [Variovorax sp. CAN2819]|uniref:DUF3592 domain-containing protein n=1 Tax=Variovorax sp. CAN15 TaxID=3046727 RepID=UPI00264A2168|nr:DUF3592 domain-containing protein [Variovorax sp. CAN15]MDN6886510.1 DUF3592 domain-containing protein [Variovorax sp. CAN15]